MKESEDSNSNKSNEEQHEPSPILDSKMLPEPEPQV